MLKFDETGNLIAESEALEYSAWVYGMESVECSCCMDLEGESMYSTLANDLRAKADSIREKVSDILGEEEPDYEVKKAFRHARLAKEIRRRTA